MMRNLLLVALAAIVVSTIAASATELTIGRNTLFVWSAKVVQPIYPTDLEAEYHHSTPTVTLTWRSASGAVEYRIYRESDTAPFDYLGSSEDQSYDDTAIAEGETYRYFVTAVAANGLESEPSNEVQVQAAEPTPTPTPEPTPGPDGAVDPPAPDSDPSEPPPPGDEPEGLSLDEAVALGAEWIANNAGGAYAIDSGSCFASNAGSHWVVTCPATDRDCAGAGCTVELRACVFERPTTRNWC